MIMFEILLNKLTVWRNETAKREGVEPFRVLPNKALEEIARNCPCNKEEMIEIKGIKDAKFSKYGRDLLRIIKSNGSTGNMEGGDANIGALNFLKELPEERQRQTDKIFSVGEFWDAVNARLWTVRAKVRGEISSVDQRSNVVYFSLKDRADESVMNCFIFRYQYDVLGIRLEEGMEVVAEGYPEVYKPYGRLSLRVSVIELEGEGQLKKEYEALKQKLESEGMFDERGKKPLPVFPRNIGLITSRDGAAIGDFVSNVGKYGLHVKFVNSSVEGKKAVFELIDAIKVFKKMQDLDVLVIIRGGGSLESLQAFNNEALIREAKAVRVPVVCGVGHDRDVSLLSLSADYSVSTPTAAAKLIGDTWEKEIGKIDRYERNMLECFARKLQNRQDELDGCYTRIEHGFRGIIETMERSCDIFLDNSFRIIEKEVAFKKTRISDKWKDSCRKFENRILETGNTIRRADDALKLNNPDRQLRMGYGIISKEGKSVRSVEEVNEGDTIKIRLFDGEAKSFIEEVKKFKG